MGQINDSVNFTGDCSAATLNARGGIHGHDKFDSYGNRKAEYTVHEQVMRYNQVSGSNVAAESRVIGTFFAAATAVEIAIVGENAQTGDRTVTVQILKGNQSSGFASILASGTPVTISASHAAREVQYVTPTTTSAARGDQIKVTVAVAGSSGTQLQGLTVSIKYRENPA